VQSHQFVAKVHQNAPTCSGQTLRLKDRQTDRETNRCAYTQFVIS